MGKEHEGHVMKPKTIELGKGICKVCRKEEVDIVLCCIEEDGKITEIVNVPGIACKKCKAQAGDIGEDVLHSMSTDIRNVVSKAVREYRFAAHADKIRESYRKLTNEQLIISILAKMIGMPKKPTESVLYEELMSRLEIGRIDRKVTIQSEPMQE